MFLTWLEKDAPLLPASAIVPEYKRHLEHKGMAPRSVALYIGSLRGFFQYASRAYGVPNLAGDVKVKVPRGQVRSPLSLDQAKTLLQSIDRGTLEGKRDYAVIALFLDTGVRRSELLKADVGDVEIHEGKVRLWIRSKGHVAKDRFVKVVPEVLSAIDAWSDARRKAQGVRRLPKDAPLFASLSRCNRFGRLSPMGLTRLVKVRMRDAGISGKRYSPHSLRHTAGTLTYRAKGDIYLAKELLGHSNVTTTENYVHMENRLRDGAPEDVLAGILFDRPGVPTGAVA